MDTIDEGIADITNRCNNCGVEFILGEQDYSECIGCLTMEDEEEGQGNDSGSDEEEADNSEVESPLPDWWNELNQQVQADSGVESG
jgi:hypothetical protein